MSNQQQNDSWRQIGRNGGHVDTSGMSSKDKQAADHEVSSGKRDTNR
ncbi:hypothetical protein [Aureimonas psammosilenae]|nr:hypothetical protein [Aureimonas psammosilenae]